VRRVGYDIRPALFNYAGIGRYVRELAVALTKLEEGPFLEMFAPSWRAGRKIPEGLQADRHQIHRGFLPGRIMDKIHHLPGMDAGRFPAKVDLFHWTDYAWPRVRTAATIMTLHDAGFAVDHAGQGRPGHRSQRPLPKGRRAPRGRTRKGPCDSPRGIPPFPASQ